MGEEVSIKQRETEKEEREQNARTYALTPDNRIFLFSSRRCRLLARELTALPRLLPVNRENDARLHTRIQFKKILIARCSSPRRGEFDRHDLARDEPRRIRAAKYAVHRLLSVVIDNRAIIQGNNAHRSVEARSRIAVCSPCRTTHRGLDSDYELQIIV